MSDVDRALAEFLACIAPISDPNEPLAADRLRAHRARMRRDSATLLEDYAWMRADVVLVDFGDEAFVAKSRACTLGTIPKALYAKALDALQRAGHFALVLSAYSTVEHRECREARDEAQNALEDIREALTRMPTGRRRVPFTSGRESAEVSARIRDEVEENRRAQDLAGPTAIAEKAILDLVANPPPNGDIPQGTQRRRAVELGNELVDLRAKVRAFNATHAESLPVRMLAVLKNPSLFIGSDVPELREAYDLGKHHNELVDDLQAARRERARCQGLIDTVIQTLVEK